MRQDEAQALFDAVPGATFESCKQVAGKVSSQSGVKFVTMGVQIGGFSKQRASALIS